LSPCRTGLARPGQLSLRLPLGTELCSNSIRIVPCSVFQSRWNWTLQHDTRGGALPCSCILERLGIHDTHIPHGQLSSFAWPCRQSPYSLPRRHLRPHAESYACI